MRVRANEVNAEKLTANLSLKETQEILKNTHMGNPADNRRLVFQSINK